jgi:hypothetical protein
VRFGGGIAPQVKIVVDHLEKLSNGESRVKNGSEVNAILGEEVSKTFEKSGLPGTNLAGQGDKALSALDTINEIGKRFFVLVASVQKDRVWRQIEWIFFEAEKCVI